MPLTLKNNHALQVSAELKFERFTGGLGMEFQVFVIGWRHAFRSEWTFIIIRKGLRGKYDLSRGGSHLR